MDSQGGVLRLAGRFDGTRMVLLGVQPPVHERIAWTPLPDGAVRQHWERSEDDGKTWTTVFDGRYVRVK